MESRGDRPRPRDAAKQGVRYGENRLALSRTGAYNGAQVSGETPQMSKIRKWAVVLPLTVATPALGAAQQFDVSSVYRKAAGSVAVVIALDQHQQPMALGSGFFIDASGALATNYHVIAGAQSIQVKVGDSDPRTVSGVFVTDPERDLAVLKVQMSNTRPLPFSPIRPAVGDRIIAIGNPLGLESTVSEGIVSGIRRINDGFELYQITAPLSPGNSGGPVLNSKGEVIGVATATLAGGQNLNFAVPIAALATLWSTATTPKPVAASTQSDESPMFGTDVDEDAVRFVDTRMEQIVRDQLVKGSIYNGTQYPIINVRVRAICFRRGISVPIDYAEQLFAHIRSILIPPGLARPFMLRCNERTTRFVLRLLDYEIVRR